MNSAEKAAMLLRCLGQPPYAHGVTELGKKINCTKSGTYKILRALVANGLAAKNSERKYTLGPMIYFLGKTYDEKISIAQTIKPFLRRLRDLTDENASFSMLVEGKAKLIYREESTHIVRVAGKPGQERPLYAGATGKILGAFMPEEELRRRLAEEPMHAFTKNTITSPTRLMEEYAKIRKQGYAISDGELNDETIGIGAPVRDQFGHIWAAISIGAPRLRVSADNRDKYIFLVQEIAKELSRALAGDTENYSGAEQLYK